MANRRSLDYIAIDELKAADVNPKGHAGEVIQDSMDRFGYTAPIEIDERTGQLVSGHGRVDALKALREAGKTPPDGITKDWKVPVVRGWASKDDDDAKAYLVSANRTVELGGWDDGLADFLQGLDDLSGVGFSLDEINELAAKITELPPDEPKDPDAVPAAPKNPVTKKGDIWLLGPHRIICGDCRDFSDVERLMDGAAINVAFTSPPYASQRKYDESSGFKPIPPDEYVDWFEDVQANVRANLADDGSWFVNIKEHCDDGERHLYVKDLTIAHKRQWGWKFVDELCWVREGVPGRWPNRFKNGYEPIFHFSTHSGIKFDPVSVGHESDDIVAYSPANTKTHSGFISAAVGGRQTGIALPTNVVRISSARADKDRGHTAEFPVALPQWFIKAYSDPGDAIYDPFMGSGSTLIAAHLENRVAYGSEISPQYVDVICKRYQEHTGELPILESTGEAVSFTQEESRHG